MSRRPVEQQEAASAFYAALDVDVSFFPAIWHLYKVGHLLMIDLDRICLPQGLSMADVHLLGAVRTDASGQARATDFAQTLHVSNAVLSTRIAKLRQKGLMKRVADAKDRRAFNLEITTDGVIALDTAIAAISRDALFVSAYHRLAASEQDTLVRILGRLHDLLDRDFVSTTRSNG